VAVAHQRQAFRAVVIGASAGGVGALMTVLGALPADFPLPLAMVLHLRPDAGNFLADILNRHALLQVRQAEEKEHLRPGVAYLAPPNYHLLVEEDRSLALNVDERVNFARPSVDVLFDSAAHAFGPALIGVVLTGANADGARGAARIKAAGGMVVVQDPAEAEASAMPAAALAATTPDRVLTLAEIAPLLMELATRGRRRRS